MKNKLIVAVIASAMSISAALAEPAAAGSTPTVEQMQANFATMQQMMDRYHGTKDPKESAALYAQHMQAMQSGMAMMQRMGPGMGMGGMAGGSMAGGPQAGNMSPAMMQQQLQAMQGRMAMMQAMMAQLLQHEAAGQPPKP